MRLSKVRGCLGGRPTNSGALVERNWVEMVMAINAARWCCCHGVPSAISHYRVSTSAVCLSRAEALTGGVRCVQGSKKFQTLHFAPQTEEVLSRHLSDQHDTSRTLPAGGSPLGQHSLAEHVIPLTIPASITTPQTHSQTTVHCTVVAPPTLSKRQQQELLPDWRPCLNPFGLENNASMPAVVHNQLALKVWQHPACLPRINGCSAVPAATGPLTPPPAS